MEKDVVYTVTIGNKIETFPTFEAGLAHALVKGYGADWTIQKRYTA